MAQKPEPPQEHKFIYYQPKWKGRKVVRHFVSAIAIGSLTLSMSYVYKKTDSGWSRDTVITRKDTKGPREQFIAAITIFLNAGTVSWTVPLDCSTVTTVDCIAGGGPGGAGATFGNGGAGGGGGGGAFAIAREIAAENEMVHAMLMAEIERDRQEIQIQMLEYERLLSKVKGRPSIGNVITLLSDAIDAFDKATHAKKRVIYDADGRPIGIEPILDED